MFEDEIEREYKLKTKKKVLNFFLGLKCKMPWHFTIHYYNENAKEFQYITKTVTRVALQANQKFLSTQKRCRDNNNIYEEVRKT
jgi:hypothetical protein